MATADEEETLLEVLQTLREENEAADAAREEYPDTEFVPEFERLARTPLAVLRGYPRHVRLQCNALEVLVSLSAQSQDAVSYVREQGGLHLALDAILFADELAAALPPNVTPNRNLAVLGRARQRMARFIGADALPADDAADNLIALEKIDLWQRHAEGLLFAFGLDADARQWLYAHPRYMHALQPRMERRAQDRRALNNYDFVSQDELIEVDDVDMEPFITTDVLTRMEGAPKNSDVQAVGLHSLARLDEKPRDELLARIVMVVLAAMHAHPHDAIIQARACHVIVSLIHDDETHGAFKGPGARPAIVDAMHAHLDNVIVQRNACAALVLLTQHSTDRLELFTAGALDATIITLRHHPTQVGICTYAMKLVDIMTTCHHLLRIPEATAVAADMLERHPTDFRIVSAALRTFLGVAITKHINNIAIDADMRLIDSIVRVFDIFAGKEEIGRSAEVVLMRLLKFSEERLRLFGTHLVATGGLAVLVRLSSEGSHMVMTLTRAGPSVVGYLRAHDFPESLLVRMAGDLEMTSLNARQWRGLLRILFDDDAQKAFHSALPRVM